MSIPSEEILPNTTLGKIIELKRRRKEAVVPLGEEEHRKVRDAGRLTVRERLDYLLDEGSFVETGMFVVHHTTDFGMRDKSPVTDGIVTGWGTIGGREVCIFSQDGTIFGGSLGEAHGEKMVKIMELAVATGRPLIGLYEGAGARVQEGAVSLDWVAKTFYQNINSSGVIPQISVIMGACAGGHAYSPVLTDFVIMVDKKSKMFVTGPEVIKTVTGEKISKEDLGGAAVNMALAGNSHYTATTEEEALDWVHDLLGYLPPNNRQIASLDFFSQQDKEVAGSVNLDEIIPDSSAQPYDIAEIIKALTDDGDYLEIQAERAENVIVAFGRIGGISVGFVANQPMVLAGCLDIAASEKAARFVRTCDSFNIPIVTLVDVPGFLPGADQEHDGILRRGAKLLYAYGEATVPKITVITRKAYGGAYCVMGSKGLGADVNLAWPTAQIAAMGAAGAVNFIYRKELKQARRDGIDIAELTKHFENKYEKQMLTPYKAAEHGIVDAVILPSETRAAIMKNLRLYSDKTVARPMRKHGNIPL